MIAAKETERQRERECWLHREQKDRVKESDDCIGNKKTDREREREIESDGCIGNRKTERKRAIAV